MTSVTNEDTFTSDEVSNVADNVADKVEEAGAVEEVSTQEDASAVVETAPVEKVKEISETEELSKAEAVTTVETVNDTVVEAADKSVELATIKTDEISKISNNKEIKKMDKDYKNNGNIKWNFTKILIDRNGNIDSRYEPTADIGSIAARAKELL